MFCEVVPALTDACTCTFMTAKISLGMMSQNASAAAHKNLIPAIIHSGMNTLFLELRAFPCDRSPNGTRRHATMMQCGVWCSVEPMYKHSGLQYMHTRGVRYQNPIQLMCNNTVDGVIKPLKVFSLLDIPLAVGNDFMVEGSVMGCYISKCMCQLGVI